LWSKFVKLMFLGGFNRLIGGVFGLSQGTLLLAVVLFAVSLKPMPWGMDRILKQAYLAPPFVELGDAVIKGSQHILK